MEEENKINFNKPMLVLKIRDVYKAPYHKNKYVIIKQRDCESLVEFKKKLHEYTENWSSGLYDLQYVLKEGTYMQPTIYSTLVRIEVRDGKVAKVWRNSPYSKRDYPIWQFMKKKEKTHRKHKPPIKKTKAQKKPKTKKHKPKKK